MAEHTIKFVFKKNTPGTVCFEEVTPKGQPPLIKTLYVQKWAAGDAQELTVTLTIPD
jgi:hypothetical protein